MEVGSVCPLRVASIVWQPRPGSWALTVVCKATFELVPGESRLAREQDPPHERDRHWGDDTTRSLRAASDLAPFKARADVLLVGHAYAPKREPVRSLAARLVVAGVDKTIDVYADRLWGPGGVVREGSPFVKMPLRYELAAAGNNNPLGVRRDGPAAVRLPNLQPAGTRLGAPSDVVAAIGFGPISPSVPLRAERAGRRAAQLLHGSWHDHPLPDDVDPAFFNAAPQDQQVASLRPDERILMDNLHPEHPRVSTRLPGIKPRATVERQGGRAEELPMTLDTLWIDTDRALCTLTWRARVPLDRPNAPGRVLVGMVGGEVEERTRQVASPMVPPAPAPAPAAPPAASAIELVAAASPARPAEAVELLWFQPACAARLVRVSRWRALLDELEARGAEADGGSNAPPDAPSASARRAVFEVLARAPAVDVAGLAAAWEGAVRGDGRFVPPLLLATGELETTFDDLEALKATLAVLASLSPGAALGELAEVARELVATPGADSATGTPGELITRLHEAVARDEGASRAAELERRASRALLERRHYQRRAVLGDVHLRALLHLGAPEPVVAYIPATARDLLPLFRRFSARVLAELCPQQDEAETSVTSLRVLALGRIVRR